MLTTWDSGRRWPLKRRRIIMTKTNSLRFLERVGNSIHDLHPSERKLADLLLDFPGDMSGYTAGELGELADVSNATVSRFFRRLGYKSFDEARRTVRDEQRQENNRYHQVGGNLPDDGPVRLHFDQSLFNLERTYEQLSTETVDSLANAIVDAPRLWVGGFRAAQAHAQYLGWQMSQVLSNTTTLPRGGETLSESISSLSKNDLVVLIALRRNANLAVPVANLVLDTGAKLAIIEDRSLEGVKGAGWCFTCHTTTNGRLKNHVASFAICNLIADRVIELSGSSGRQKMSRIERNHHSLGEI